MAYRVPRGYSRTDWPWQPRFEHDGTTPSYAVRPAKFLPVAAEDQVHDDPIVLIPGTFVGRLDLDQHSALDASFLTGGPLVPACPVAYTVTYSALDLATSAYGGTPDIDEDEDTVVAATGASTATVAATRPLWVTLKPHYAGWLEDRHTNYVRQLFETGKSKLLIARIPAITANEKLIRVGDKVMLDNTTSPTWDPYAATPSTVGRLKRFDGAAVALTEYVVGKCVNKTRLARQSSASEGQTLRAAIGTSAPRTLTNINQTAEYLWPAGEQFEMDSKIETAKGLGLGPSSETLGRPPELLYARADASGDFWALDIEICI